MTHDPDDDLAVLGLGPGASQQQIREAYRDLTKVWHPDRFNGNARLQRKGEEKLKAINRAYARLRTEMGQVPTEIETAPPQEGLDQLAGAVRPSAPSTPKPGGPAQPAAPPAVKNRLVRMQIPHAEVAVDDRRGTLIDLSLTGGQLLLDVAPALGDLLTIGLHVQRQTLVLRGKVVRTNRIPTSGTPRWTVGVTFVELSLQDRQAIPKFYNLLIDQAGRNLR